VTAPHDTVVRVAFGLTGRALAAVDATTPEGGRRDDTVTAALVCYAEASRLQPGEPMTVQTAAGEITLCRVDGMTPRVVWEGWDDVVVAAEALPA
jgi:hypothetical protein